MTEIQTTEIETLNTPQGRGADTPPEGYWKASDGQWYPPLADDLAALYAPPAVQTKTNGLAVASLVCGVLMIWPLALIFGFVGRKQIARSHGAQTGRGMAIAGIWLGAVLPVAVVALVVVLQLVGDSSNEAARGANPVPRSSVPVETRSTTLNTTPPVVTSADATLVELAAESCRVGDALACDYVYYESASGSSLEQLGLDCGPLSTGGSDADCVELHPDTVGPFTNTLVDLCDGSGGIDELGWQNSCDVLYTYSAVGSPAEYIGMTCGGRVIEDFRDDGYTCVDW